MGRYRLLWDNLWSTKKLAATLVRRPQSNGEILIPQSGAVAVTAGIAGVFGNWTNLGSESFDTIITQLMAIRQSTLNGIARMTTEFGTGNGAFPIDALYEMFTLSDPTGDDGGAPGSIMPSDVLGLPALTQLQARVNDSKTSNVIYNVWACGFVGVTPNLVPITGLGTLANGRFLPNNTSANGITTTAGVAPNMGAYVTVLDPAPNNMLLVYLAPCGGVAQSISPFTGFEIGIGAAGSEQSGAVLPTGNMFRPSFIWPPLLVLSGERIALRSLSNVANARSAVIKAYDVS